MEAKKERKKKKMNVKKLKLHSNYLHPNSSLGSGREGRINKPHSERLFNTVYSTSHDMCVGNNKDFTKTIVTKKSNGLSFKARYDMLYNVARAIVDESMPERAWYLARKTRFDKIAAKFQKNNPFLHKVLTNEKFLKAMKFMNDNALLSDAGIALFYTCCLRPMSIAVLPTKDNKEKKKNVYQIGHSISTGVIGFISAFVLQTPIKDAISKINQAVSSKNSEKYISKAGEYLFKKENIEKTRTILERSHQPISLPLRAMLTIYLVPKVLNLVGLTKNAKNQNSNEKTTLPYNAFQYFAAFKGSKDFNNKISGGLKNAN